MCQSSLFEDAARADQLLDWRRAILNCCNVFTTAALKDKGNEAYARGDYGTAVRFYTDGLAELRDMQPLYTNRAQVITFKCFGMKPPAVFVICR